MGALIAHRELGEGKGQMEVAQPDGHGFAHGLAAHHRKPERPKRGEVIAPPSVDTQRLFVAQGIDQVGDQPKLLLRADDHVGVVELIRRNLGAGKHGR